MFTDHCRQFKKDIAVIHDLPNTVIKSRREEYAKVTVTQLFHNQLQLNIQQETQLDRDVDFLDMLMCVQDEPLQDDEIRAEVDTFMVCNLNI